MRPLRLFCSALALAASLALPASAAVTLTVTQSGATIFGTNGNSSATVVETTLRPLGLGVLAGGFAVKGNLDGLGADEFFTAWCLDIATYLRLPSIYTTTTTPFSSGALTLAKISNIERLFETGYKSLDVTDNIKSAGFQLALWEVLYENSGTFNLAIGNFSVSSSAAIAAGQALLNGMAGAINWNYDLTFLQSNDPRNTTDGHYSQHLVTANTGLQLVAAVPLPAGGVLLLAGLGALAALRRRRAGTSAA